MKFAELTADALVFMASRRNGVSAREMNSFLDEWHGKPTSVQRSRRFLCTLVRSGVLTVAGSWDGCGARYEISRSYREKFSERA